MPFPFSYLCLLVVVSRCDLSPPSLVPCLPHPCSPTWWSWVLLTFWNQPWAPNLTLSFISCIGHSVLPQQQKMYQDKDRASAEEILTWLSVPVWHVVVCLWGVVEDSWVVEKAVGYIIGKGTWSLSICGGKSQAGSFLWGKTRYEVCLGIGIHCE